MLVQSELVASGEAAVVCMEEQALREVVDLRDESTWSQYREIVFVIRDSGTIEESKETLQEVFARYPYALDAIVVQGNSWLSAICEDTDCCPPEGKPVHN